MTLMLPLLAFVFGTALVIAAAYATAFLLRFDLTIPAYYRHTFLITLPGLIALRSMRTG